MDLVDLYKQALWQQKAAEQQAKLGDEKSLQMLLERGTPSGVNWKVLIDQARRRLNMPPLIDSAPPKGFEGVRG